MTNAMWQKAKLLSEKQVASNVKSLTFSLPSWEEPKAGQHFDLRLTAENGYQAERSYSLATPPEAKGVAEFGIQILEDGEVSPYLWQLKPGDEVEMRGPIGGHFVWSVAMPGPLVLIGGGSGMVPLMSMLRHHENHLATDAGREVIFLVSARDLDRVLYKEELTELEKSDKNLKVAMTLTDNPPTNWQGYTRRVDKEMLAEVCGSLASKMPMIYICGPTPFVEAVAKSLVEIGFNPHEIRTERFGG